MKRIALLILLAGCEVHCPGVRCGECPVTQGAFDELRGQLTAEQRNGATLAELQDRTQRNYYGCTANEVLLNQKIEELKAELATATKGRAKAKR